MALVTFQESDQLGEIVIDSPPLNLFEAEMHAGLRLLLDRMEASDEVKVERDEQR